MNQQRLKKVIEHMQKQSLTQIIVSSTAPIYYLTGLWIDPHERMIALYIDINGKTALFGNKMFGIQNIDIELILHDDSQNPVYQLSQIIQPGKIGIDKFWPSKFLIGLLDLRKDITPVLGSSPVDFARMIKDDEEIALLKKASEINDQVVTQAIVSLKNGKTESELAAIVNQEFLKRGADISDGMQLVCFGENAADPHHAPNQTVIKSGDSVVFDLFTPISRYWCDMTRTVFFQCASSQQKEVYEIVKQANLKATQSIRPGIPLCEIDSVARTVITKAGYGEFFTHRLGHGIGLECHEIPDVSSTSQITAQPGMVFSIEPGIYLPGQFGVRIEDLVLVTKDGFQILNAAPKELQIIS